RSVMTVIAYAFVNADGTIRDGSAFGVVKVQHTGLGSYKITVNNNSTGIANIQATPIFNENTPGGPYSLFITPMQFGTNPIDFMVNIVYTTAQGQNPQET